MFRLQLTCLTHAPSIEACWIYSLSARLTSVVRLVLSSPPHPLMHFGMAGWFHIRDLEDAYYRPNPAKESSEWPPKYWKFHLQTAEEPKCEAAFVDFRRFARIRLLDCPADEIRTVSPLVENGPDPVVDKDIVTEEWLAEKLASKHIPVKALLLDQGNISGIGNWVGDEILYDAKIHPEQYSNTLSRPQVTQLHKSIHYVCGLAVDTLSDSNRFPEHWLFKHRWGKGKKDSTKKLPNGLTFVHLTVGGRTSCVVPSVQKKTGPVAGDVNGAGENGSQTKGKKKGGKPVQDEADDAETTAPAAKSRQGGKKRKPEVKEEADAEADEEESKTAKRGKGARGETKAKADEMASRGGRRRSARVSGKGV